MLGAWRVFLYPIHGKEEPTIIQFNELIHLLQGTGTDVWGCCAFDQVAGNLLPCRAQKRLMEGARSILIGMFPYFVNGEKGNLCQYARVPDYHHVVGGLLQKAACLLKENYPSFSFEPFVDNSPIPEVRTAALAGLGVIGDNGLLIHPKYGSWCVIGEIVTDLPVIPARGEPVHCMHCGACRRACPGGALEENLFIRDKCLSHITQKKKGLTPEEEQKIAQNGLCWGCDTCQTVCPYNQTVKINPIPAFAECYASSYPVEEVEIPRAWEWRGKAVIERNLGIILAKKGHTKPTK